MPLSEKTKNRLIAPLAISPIMKRCALPGLIGMVLLAVGFVQKIRWLKITGLILIAPMLWVYFVILFIFLPILIFSKIRKGKTRTQ
jgi:hypothetical protein